MVCESVNVTMKTTINFYDMTTLHCLVIKEKFEWMCVIGPYFVWVAVREALFQVSVGYCGWVGVGGALFCKGGCVWAIILGEWEWVGHYFGWVRVVALFDNAPFLFCKFMLLGTECLCLFFH